MWKLVVGFVVFAAVAMYILTRPGADIDLGGEKHGVDAPQSAASTPAEAAAAAASAAASAASAASSVKN